MNVDLDKQLKRTRVKRRGLLYTFWLI